MNQNTKDFTFKLEGINCLIVDALCVAIEDIMPDIMSEHNLLEQNGYGQFRWNVIIAQLRGQCKYLGDLDFNTCRRGAWKTPVLFHPASRNLITFMTENTFKTVQHRKDKAKHYLCGGASFNQGIKAHYEQMALEIPCISMDEQKWVAKSREELAAAVHKDVGEISGHILVLFSIYADTLLSVRAVRLTPNLEISSEEEDWSLYIHRTYDTGRNIEPQQNNESYEEEFVELL